MIPSKLELKNFICYPDSIQTVSFDDYSMICLSGKNGNGKSALLDAITWVLWGQARKTSGVAKADDGLLRLGQTRMMVSLEFKLGLARYRVRREYAKTYGKPYAALDFEIFNQQTNAFVSLTDKTIRATQDKIERCIGLNFDTFINSAFLKQGQSNEFSKKTAKERKQILTDILGLSKYTKLQQLALEKMRNNNEEKRVLLKVEEQRMQELAGEIGLLEQHGQEQKKLVSCNASLGQVTNQINELEANKKNIDDQMREYALLQKDMAALVERQQEREVALRALVKQWKQVHYQALLLPHIPSLTEERAKLAIQEKKMLQEQQRMLVLQEQLLMAKERYQKQEMVLRTDQDLRMNQLRLDFSKHEHALKQIRTDLQRKTDVIKQGTQVIKQLEQSADHLQQQLIQRATIESTLASVRAQFDKRKTFYSTMVQMGNRLNLDLKALQAKCGGFESSDTPTCPLCEQFLSVEKKQQLHQELASQGLFLNHQLDRLKKVIPALKELLVKQHQQLENLEKQLLACNDNMLKDRELKHQISLRQEERTRVMAEVEQINAEILVHEKAIDIVRQQLVAAEQAAAQRADDPSLVIIRKEIKLLEDDRNRLQIHQEQYAQLQEALKKLDQAIEQCQYLRHDLERQDERKMLITEQIIHLKKIQQRKAQLQITLSQVQEQYAALDQLNERMQQLIIERTSLTAIKEQLLPLVGNLESSLQRLAVLKQDQEQHKKIIGELDDEIGSYQALATAFSKDGIQALLIEEVIPEIETEANAILAKLTNNQSQIFVESLRDLKSGGVKETLDIKIADNIGIRPYEMFSGGEAFRIDFALRIAISKLLARRAGTSLQTLIIDEGFGSQDEDGLARLMDSLHLIQHDFSKVIIVSHLAEFKDNFPVHFVVEKGAAGSTIRIEERG